MAITIKSTQERLTMTFGSTEGGEGREALNSEMGALQKLQEKPWERIYDLIWLQP